MKRVVIFYTVFISIYCSAQSEKISFVTTDIDNFWTAFDKITHTTDTLRQYRLLDDHYINKGTPGLADLMEVRNYTRGEYLHAIKSYPKFWQSIRKNTGLVTQLIPMINADLRKLEEVYSATKPATIYFAVGVFRTNGTVRGSHILIGSEAALADHTTIIDELPEWRQPFYTENNQIENIGLLVVHEYIHTLQNELVHNLLSMCLYEGIAEFVSCHVTGKPSTVPAIEFGRSHREEVVKLFVSDLFIMRNNYNWLWGENTNQFKIRDLGYYIGYEMAERYYKLSADKTLAIKELIELDYRNERAIERIVDAVRLLPKPLAKLYEEFDAMRPRVVGIDPIKNRKDGKLPPGKQIITIHFSEPLNGSSTGVDYGPLGKDHFPAIDTRRSWSSDKKSWTIEVDLKANTRYQFLIDNNFRLENGIPLKPYLAEFQTEN